MGAKQTKDVQENPALDHNINDSNAQENQEHVLKTNHSLKWDEDIPEDSEGHREHIGKRRQSRIEKIKSRKLPHTVRLKIVEESGEQKLEHGGRIIGGSDHGICHLEKLKRRKMPVGMRIFGEHHYKD